MTARADGATDHRALFAAWCREGLFRGGSFWSWAEARSAVAEPPAAVRACCAVDGCIAMLVPGAVIRAMTLENPERLPAIADSRLLGVIHGVTPFIWTVEGEVFAGAGLTSVLVQAGGSGRIGVRAMGGIELAGGKVVGLSDETGAPPSYAANPERLREFGRMLEATDGIVPSARVRCHTAAAAFSGSWEEFRPGWLGAVKWTCDQGGRVVA